jgi:hypothetical protein
MPGMIGLGMANLTRQQRRAAERAAKRRGQPPPRGLRLPFKWQEGVAIILAIAAMMLDHTVAFGLCILAAVALGIWGILSHEEYERGGKSVGIIVVLAIGGVLFLFLKIQNDQRELALNEGVLEPGNDYPDHKCGALNKKWTALLIGPGLFYLDKFPQSILKIANQDILTLDRVGDNLVIQTLNLFDEQGYALVSINKAIAPNNFWVAPDVRKYRPDKHTLVVFDKRATEVLRIVYLNPHAISVNGIFRYAGYSPVIITPTFFQMGGFRDSGSTCTSQPISAGNTIYNFR